MKIWTNRSFTFGGSRDLGSEYAPLVGLVVRAALDAGFDIRSACAMGADAFAVGACAAAAPDRLSVFCAAGVQPGSAAALAQEAGSRVVSFAGGQPNIPYRARLALRSRRSISNSSGVVFFLATPSSRGSLNTAAAAILEDIPVFVFCCAFRGPPDSPPGCAGEWRPSRLADRSCWKWQPEAHQPDLF